MYDYHDMAKALILSEEILTAVVDKVKAHGKGHGELGELFYLTANVSKLRQIPNEKHWIHHYSEESSTWLKRGEKLKVSKVLWWMNLPTKDGCGEGVGMNN